MSARAAVLIPAYQAAASLPGVIQAVRAAVPEFEILVVDDGSSDGSGAAGRAAGAKVLTHPANWGKGAALKTGFRDLMGRVGAILTLDADGQHAPEEILPLLEAMEKTGASICVGTRMGDVRAMPWARRIANWGSSALLSALAGTRLPDTQSGYRVYRSQDLPGLLGGGPGYDYESEVLIRACRSGMLVVFEPISTRYGDEQSHFRPLRDGLRFLRLVLRNLPGAPSGPRAGSWRQAAGKEVQEENNGSGRGSAW